MGNEILCECGRPISNTADELRELCPTCLGKIDKENDKRKQVEVERTLDGIPRDEWPFSLVLRG
jgi:hypothetical protein